MFRRRKKEVSPGGSTIHRHEQAAEPDFAAGDAELIEAVTAHITTYVGEPAMVYHQLVSEYVHVDIHMVAPTDERPWHTLITSGMSERPMATPKDASPDYLRGELVLSLPPDWPLDHESFHDEANYWPVRLLQELATFPHKYETLLWFGHTVPHGDPPNPYAPGTEMCGTLLGSPVLIDQAFRELRLDDDRVVQFLAPLPIYEDEMDLKLELGAGELFDRMERAEVSELLDPRRPSVA